MKFSSLSTYEQDLLQRILEVTDSLQSVPFYEKAIQTLGPGAVEEELAELRYAIHGGRVESPAKYLTTLLRKRLDRAGPAASEPAPLSEPTHFSPSQLELFQELLPRRTHPGEEREELDAELRYSRETVPWLTFVVPDFFTLSTNRAKSDRVLAKFRTLDGEVFQVPMLRGKYFPDDDGRGILTPEHGRILGALEVIWVEQNQPASRFRNGAVHGYCDVQVRHLAQLLGWRSFSGAALSHLKKKVLDLKTRGYYLEWSGPAGAAKPEVKGLGFSFLADASVHFKKIGKTPATTLRVIFSDPFSRQLLLRRAVSRSKEILEPLSELAWLVRMYLEPKLLSLDGREYPGIETSRLIEELHLPPAGWHAARWQRRQIFQRVVRELNGARTADGRLFRLDVEAGLRDCLLAAWLLPAEKA